MRLDIVDILAPPIGATVWLVLSWSFARSVNRGRVLTATQKRMIGYGLVFVLGMGYLIMVGAGKLHWSLRSLLAALAVWGMLVGLLAWWRSGRERAPSRILRKPPSASLAEALPTVGLLVCMVAATIQWSLVPQGFPHVIWALLWTAGIGAMIALARRNRRATVVMGLRAFLGLAVIGAISRASLAALAVAGGTALLLFVLERLWKKEPPVTDLKSLASEPTKPTEAHSGEPLH